MTDFHSHSGSDARSDSLTDSAASDSLDSDSAEGGAASANVAPSDPTIVLASASPRRLELLSRIGIEPLVVPAGVDESELPGESPEDYVLRVATDKAHAVALAIDTKSVERIVLAADTTVVLDGKILGKPNDAADAARILGALSGRTHDVLTAVVVIGKDSIEHVALARTAVRFGEVGSAEIDWYIKTGEPFGKAGAYAIQGVGEFMVESIEGAPSTVIGLPLQQTLDLLLAAGFVWDH